MAKCLVTGGTGFTGSYLIRKLLADGNEVRVLVRRRSINKITKNNNLDIVYGDIRDRETVFQSMEDVEEVYHLAAAFRETKLSNRDYRMINIVGTKNLLDASIKESIKRFIHCSTVGVHGHISNPPANESTAYNPGDIYQETKVEGEKLAKSYFEKQGLPVTIIRPVGIYGPGEMRFLRLFKSIYDGRFIMIGRGDLYYHMSYVTDIIDGMILATRKKHSIGETYILAGNEYTTLRELVNLIADVMNVPPPRRSFPFIMPVYIASFLVEMVTRPLGIEPPIHRRRVDIFRKSRAFDITKAKKEIGYQPKVDLKTGINLTFQWYKKMGHL